MALTPLLAFLLGRRGWVAAWIWMPVHEFNFGKDNMGKKAGKRLAGSAGEKKFNPFTSSSSPLSTSRTTSPIKSSEGVGVAAQATGTKTIQSEKQYVDSEITTCLSTITELRKRVTGLQESRKSLEDEMLGVFPQDLSLKQQWKLVKKYKNEGNKVIFIYIDNVREENKSLHLEAKITSKEIGRYRSMMEQRQLEGAYLLHYLVQPHLFSL